MRKAALIPAELNKPDLDTVDVGGGTGFCTIGIVEEGVQVRKGGKRGGVLIHDLAHGGKCSRASPEVSVPRAVLALFLRRFHPDGNSGMKFQSRTMRK